jgi:hypothetical protein
MYRAIDLSSRSRDDRAPEYDRHVEDDTLKEFEHRPPSGMMEVWIIAVGTETQSLDHASGQD